MKHVISALVENKPGVLARIVGLISGRGYNIETLNVAPIHDETLSRITITVLGDDKVLEQVVKQLNKLVDVVKVNDLTGKKYVSYELLLVEVSCVPSKRTEIVALAEIFGARVVNVQAESMIISMTDGPEKIDSFIGFLKSYGIVQVSRTGPIAMAIT